MTGWLSTCQAWGLQFVYTETCKYSRQGPVTLASDGYKHLDT